MKKEVFEKSQVFKGKMMKCIYNEQKVEIPESLLHLEELHSVSEEERLIEK